ncbi:MAG: Wzz/FepE/Etk N-terminal domain-containing protein, partial [Alphaproteobacteria bacterium]
MLGDNEEIAERNVPEPVPTGPSRSAIVVPDRGRGYGAYEWFTDEHKDEGAAELQKYLRILRKHWLAIAAVVILAIFIGVAKTLLTTPIYTAATTMQIDREPTK